MPDPIAEPGSQATLRQQAQQQLVAGIAPVSGGWGVSVEALALLHRLASAPASAADALKLLHELQVHQVELDLQQAQIEANEHEMSEELARYRGLYDHAPVAQFVVDAGGRIVEINRTGARLLGISNSDACGRRFDEFLAPDSRLLLAALLRDVRSGGTNTCCAVRPERGTHETSLWQIFASALPGSDSVQMVVTDGAGSPEG